MRSLEELIHSITDLRRQHDLCSRRYYNRDSDTTILLLIAKELLDEIPQHWKLPLELYLSLAQINRTNSVNTKTLCLIYKEVISLKTKYRIIKEEMNTSIHEKNTSI